MKTSTLNLILPLAALSCTASAQTTIWTGSGNANNGGDWSVSANWDGPVPGAGATAVLNDVSSGARVVTYDASASGSLAAISITQATAGATNTLSIKRDLTLDNELVIGASAGTSEVRLGGAAAKVTLQVGPGSASPGVTLESGGRFVFDYLQGSNAGNDLKANVTINTGGVFQIGSSATGTTTATAQATITRGLTLAGGALVFDTASHAAARLSVQGAFTATGGSISATGGAPIIMIDGPGATLSGTDIGTTHFMVRNSGAKSLSIDRALNRLYLTGRGAGDLEVSVTAPSSTGLYFSHEAANQKVTLKLAGDLALATNAFQPNATGGAGTGTTTYGIDTAGHTLDLSAGQAFGKWTPNKGNSPTAVWELKGSAGQGGIRARAFDFSSANVRTEIGAGLVLEAISGPNVNSQASNLSGTGAIDPASVFRFNPANPAHLGTLESGRDIGVLEVAAGTLAIAGATDFAAQGGIVVAAGALLDLGGRTVSAPSYTFGIDGTATGLLGGGASAVSLAGADLTFRFTGVAVPGVYDVFATTHGIVGDPDSVSIVGSHVLALTPAGNVWSGTADGYSFSFSSETGDLVVTTAIPEPSAAALLAGGLVLAALALRRRPA